MHFDSRLSATVNYTNRCNTMGLVLWWVLLIAPVLAEARPIVLIADEQVIYHKQFVESFNRHLTPAEQSGLVVLDSHHASLNAHSAIILDRDSIVVTVGSAAAEQVMPMDSRARMLHAMLTDQDYQALEERYNGDMRQHSVLYIEQPLGRYLHLINSVFPEGTRITSLFGPLAEQNRIELGRQARLQGVSLREVVLGSEQDLASVLNDILPQTQVLLTLPDPEVINSKTAKTLIYGAFRHHVPLVGYSQAIVKAGALMAVYSTPEELGRQAAELVSASLSSRQRPIPRYSWPRYYSVSVNFQVARSIDITLPDEKTIVARIREMER